ncbi:MAG: threonine aldolase [Candidatus Bathyarchaeota archaeon]|nr:MAG: threonine aldolase [Candidatus Bathyarchaeota archaeon]
MVEKNLDFRSDTTTWPTPEMREAAAKAAVGDMGYGEDPTVNELERVAAEVFGKEAALFCTSGTQGNAVSVLAHTDRGDSFVCEARAHLYTIERGHWSVIGSLIPKLVKGVDGFLPPDDVRVAIGRRRRAGPKTSLLCLENTHLSSGGSPLSPEQMKEDYDVAKEYGLGVHTDGARIFNAAVALGVDVKEIAKGSDTIQACLSKGLAAPVGSVVVGTESLIEKAKYYRGMLGGSMRQAGIIAAPGIIALTKMVDRLAEDHANAKVLAEGLQRLGIELRLPLKTNMLFIDYTGIGWTGEDWSKACERLGWKSRGGAMGTRLVVHYGIEREDIEAFLEGLEKII